MKDKIKLLMVSKNFYVNGITNVIMNYCRLLDKNKFDITIYAGKPIDSYYIEECKKIGVKLIEGTSKDVNKFNYYIDLNKVLSSEKYDIIHINGNSSAMLIELLIAKLHGIKVRIAHSHNSSQMGISFLQKISIPLFRLTYTNAFACSKLAGGWLFKSKFDVLPNGFKVEKFIFSNEIREKVRNELGVKDEFLIGHVGAFNNQKNQEYVLKVFEKILESHNNFKLIFIGQGGKFSNIENIVKNSNYKDKVILYGKAYNTADLYNAMDLFVLPSRFEGLGIVLLEAQINGIPCIASTNVPKEASITNNVTYLGIDDSNICEWKDNIITTVIENTNREIDINDVKIQNYNIYNNIKFLEEKYMQFLKRKE